MKRLALLVLVTLAPVTGCGYRIVRNSDVVAKKFAADSAAMFNLENQIAELRTRYRADSTHWAADLTAARSVPPPVPGVSPDTLHARDLEIASLRDQLTKANAELDRIKRRLASPRT